MRRLPGREAVTSRLPTSVPVLGDDGEDGDDGAAATGATDDAGLLDGAVPDLPTDAVTPGNGAGGRSVPLGLVLGGVGALAGVGATAGAAVVGRRRVDRGIQKRVDDLLAAAERPTTARVTSEDLVDLPDPVRRYLETVLPAGRRHARTVRLRQTGELKLRGKWRELTAEQHVSVGPPGFVWDARVRVLPGVSARVVDAYQDGEGELRARALSLLPVASASPGPGMNEAELLRYLAECVWCPTALLPAAGVTWDPVGDDAARATLTDGETTASAVFHFNDRNYVTRVHADRRYRQETDDHAPWTGYYGRYERRAGVVVPTEAEVAWDPPTGDGPYWRATIDRVAYDVGRPATEEEAADGVSGGDGGLRGRLP